MTIGFAYNIKDSRTEKTDLHAEYETQETIDAVSKTLSRYGSVISLPCDSSFLDRIIESKPDLVFNIAEGWGSRDRESFVPVVCTMLGIPYSGSDAVALGITMDKALTKRVLENAGIRTTPFELYDSRPDSLPAFGFPAFIKPNCDGSSRGITSGSLIRDFKSFTQQTEHILIKYGSPVIAEPYLDGHDYCVALLGNNPPRVLPTCEVLLGHVDDIPFFSWEYKCYDTDLLDMSPAIGRNVLTELEEMSHIAWNVLSLRDYARIDFRTDRSGVPHLLEINALPGLSPISGIFVQQAKEAGMTFDDIISVILARAFSDATRTSAARTI